MKLQAVVFDMDGLMFDTERIVQYSWDVAGERLGYEKLGQNIYHTLGMNRAGRQVYFQKKYGMDFPFDTFRAYNREAFFARVQKEGLPVKPGLYTLLDFLKNLHIPMAVATSSGGDYARDNLEQAGITAASPQWSPGIWYPTQNPIRKSIWRPAANSRQLLPPPWLSRTPPMGSAPPRLPA